jgi:hypothetical protein
MMLLSSLACTPLLTLWPSQLALSSNVRLLEPVVILHNNKQEDNYLQTNKLTGIRKGLSHFHM